MTYRERREARAERLREWAQKRRSAASKVAAEGANYRGDIAFNTQPGHIPERARLIAREDRAFASLQKAGSMESRAAEIERQADRAIYSDDPDAPERIRERIAELEAWRDTVKRFNASARKGSPDWSLLSEAKAVDLRRTWAACPYHKPERGFPAYELQNLSGNIARQKKRLEEIERRQKEEAACEEAGGFLLKRHPEINWCSVRFADKPDRAVLEALKAAGYAWGGGKWSGYLDRLPEIVSAMDPARGCVNGSCVGGLMPGESCEDCGKVSHE